MGYTRPGGTTLDSQLSTNELATKWCEVIAVAGGAGANGANPSPNVSHGGGLVGGIGAGQGSVALSYGGSQSEGGVCVGGSNGVSGAFGYSPMVSASVNVACAGGGGWYGGASGQQYLALLVGGGGGSGYIAPGLAGATWKYYMPEDPDYVAGIALGVQNNNSGHGMIVVRY